MSASPSQPDLLPSLPLGMRKVHRGELSAVAVIGLILGIIGLVFPGATLLTVAIIFGSYLIASGIFRITAAFVVANLSPGLRWLTALLGLVVVVAGIFTLANPFESLVVLAFAIGFGWVAEGIIDFMGGLRGTVVPRWLGFVSGVISIAAGVAMFVLPAGGIESLMLIGSALLIVVSVTTLLTLPRAPKTAV